jgi:hypothetical protein
MGVIILKLKAPASAIFIAPKTVFLPLAAPRPWFYGVQGLEKNSKPL